jgi:predicted Zn-dependent peptidase
MITIEKFTLQNGLRVLVNQDKTTPIMTVNILYNVGSKDEQSEKTGFAHLFEHLMFGGSAHIMNFDRPLERVGGENNAFTNTDITNYYLTIPRPNLETALWLESDRMLNLAFSEKSLEVQRNVVIEEFRQRYLNQPYGDVMLLLRPLVYKTHPYQWATIGKIPEHIEQTTMGDVKAFYQKHYNPSNAILSFSGNMSANELRPLVEKWFGGIENQNGYDRKLPAELPQTEKRILKVERDVPTHVLVKAFKMVDRYHPDYYAFDLISDLLSNGHSSRFYQRLVKQKRIFNQVDAYITGEIEPGMFIIKGTLAGGHTMEEAEAAVDKELTEIKKGRFTDSELQKVKNKVEAVLEMSEINGMYKAMMAAYHELLGDASQINDEMNKYRRITRDDIIRVANTAFPDEKASVLYYYARDKK